jgi:hypothetical protein
MYDMYVLVAVVATFSTSIGNRKKDFFCNRNIAEIQRVNFEIANMCECRRILLFEVPEGRSSSGMTASANDNAH